MHTPLPSCLPGQPDVLFQRAGKQKFVENLGVTRKGQEQTEGEGAEAKEQVGSWSWILINRVLKFRGGNGGENGDIEMQCPAVCL